jgi:hypothetical protein
MSEQNVITEAVDPTSYHTSSIMLINAMAALAGDKGNIAEIFKLEYPPDAERPTVDVQLFVNGVSVPFKESIEDAWQQLEASIDREVHKRAMELLSRSRFDKLISALDNAEWQIEDALNKALEKK